MTAQIFIVDDDMDDIILLNEIFSTTEYANAVRFFNNPEGVIPSLDVMPDSCLPLLIISDMNMPKLSGIELLKSLKESNRYQPIPVIILSTSSAEKEKQKALLEGAVDFITKPATRAGYASVLDKIEHILENGRNKSKGAA